MPLGQQESEGVEEAVWEHVVTWDRGEQEGEGDHMATWRGLAWDLSNLNFSAFRCSKLLNGSVQGLRIRRMGGQERDKLIQADVAKEMAFKEGREMSNIGSKKLILSLGVQPNGA